MPVNIPALQAQINAIQNSVVRTNAQALFDTAQSSNNDILFQTLEDTIGKSASGEGTGIFYSGHDRNGNNNHNSATQCQDHLGDGNSYNIFETEVGQYVDNIGAQRLSYMPEGTRDQLWNLASSMMADQAGPNVIAFVDGAAGSSTWMNHEITALLENGNTSINTLDTSTLSNSSQSVEDISGESFCFMSRPPPHKTDLQVPRPAFPVPSTQLDGKAVETDFDTLDKQGKDAGLFIENSSFQTGSTGRSCAGFNRASIISPSLNSGARFLICFHVRAQTAQR